MKTKESIGRKSLSRSYSPFMAQSQALYISHGKDWELVSMDCCGKSWRLWSASESRIRWMLCFIDGKHGFSRWNMSWNGGFGESPIFPCSVPHGMALPSSIHEEGNFDTLISGSTSELAFSSSDFLLRMLKPHFNSQACEFDWGFLLRTTLPLSILWVSLRWCDQTND